MIPRTWLEFFKVFHPKTLMKGGRKDLPLEIRRLIVSYLRDPPGFYVQDLGSIHGTYF